MTLAERLLAPAALAGLLVLAGCSDRPAGSFAATLEGPLEGELKGYATFCRRPDRGDFLLVMGTQRDSVGLVLGRDTAAVPGPGPYAVVDRGDTLSGGRFWMRPELQNLEAVGSYAFTVDEGEVRVVSADSSWIRGRFRVQLIARDTAIQVDTLTRTVRRFSTEYETVQGTFTAARAEPCAGLAERQ